MTDTVMEEGSMDRYLSEIRGVPLLTEEEERELARRCAQGDEAAIRRMVSANLRLVVRIARKYADCGVPLLDLIQEGSMGLITAAKKFDYTLGFRFSTYADDWIRQRIGRYAAERAALIRVPAYTAERIRLLDRARNAFLLEHGREPDGEELSVMTGLSVEKIGELLSVQVDVGSLDTPVGEEDDAALVTLLPADEDLDPQAELIRRELKSLLDGLLERLTDRQRTILRLHYGLEDGVCMSLQQISAQLGISKERVRQIERQAMDKLQKFGSNVGLEVFLE